MNVQMIESMFDRQDKGFLDPIAMSHLQRAVRGNKKLVVLGGIQYEITYGFRGVYPVSGEKRESIHLRRTDGVFTPRGYVSMKRITEFQFEKDEK